MGSGTSTIHFGCAQNQILGSDVAFKMAALSTLFLDTGLVPQLAYVSYDMCLMRSFVFLPFAFGVNWASRKISKIASRIKTRYKVGNDLGREDKKSMLFVSFCR